MDKPFFLENDNVDASQRNVVFLVRGEKAKTVIAVAGTLFIQDVFCNNEFVAPLLNTWDLKKPKQTAPTLFSQVLIPISTQKHFYWIAHLLSMGEQSIVRC